MQVLDEQSKAYFNFINSLKSESTRKSYTYCIEKFLGHYEKDLDQFLRLSQDEMTNLIIKYFVNNKISNQYKNLMSATLKHACEINDVVLNWKKIKKFINSNKTGNETNGKDRGYIDKEIQKKINEPEFPREYQGLYLGKVGNLLTQDQINECIQLGQQYKDIPVSQYTLKSVGIDPGFSSSATGIIVLEHIKPELTEDKIRVTDSRLIEKGDPNQIVNLYWDMWKRNGYVNTVFGIDGSNRAMVNLLKIRWDESLTWETSQSFGPNTKIRPVNFSTEHRNMLSNLHAMISKGYLAIEEKHDKLLTSLRTAYAEELNLKKEQTSYSDLLDALRLALKGYQIE